MTDLRPQIIALSEKIGNMRNFNPGPELRQAIEDAASSRNAGDMEAYEAAHHILAHMNRNQPLCAVRSSD